MTQTHQKAQDEGKAPETTNTPTMAPEGQQDAAKGSKSAIQLTEEQQDRLRTAAGGRKFGLSRLPDGSFRLDVTIPVEVANWLEAGAESAQEPLEEYIQRNVV